MQKSPNQIVFNPATQISADHSDIPDGQPMPSGKKLVRKVKKGAASGMSKTDINGLIMPSSAGLTTGSVTATSKMGPSKNNISH